MICLKNNILTSGSNDIMKKLKKSLAFITTISMLATLAACNNSADSNDSNDELQQHVYRKW